MPSCIEAHKRFEYCVQTVCDDDERLFKLVLGARQVLAQSMKHKYAEIEFETEKPINVSGKLPVPSMPW